MSSANHSHINPLVQLLAAATLLIICTAIYLGNVGVRGSDQYWYLADTETLINDQAPTTNTVFPGFLLRNPDNTNPTAFVHNGPALHLYALVGKITGGFDAWKILNIIFYALAALFTGFAVNVLAGRNAAALATLFYAITPIAVWQTGNLLLETFFTVVSAGIFFIALYAHKKPPAGWALLPFFFIGALSHPMFLLLAVLYCVYALFRKQFLLSLAIVFLLVVAITLSDTWFPSSFQSSMEILITSTIPGKTNMLWQLSDTSVALDAQLIKVKLIDALRMQFAVPQLAPFYISTNLGGLALLWLVFTRFKQLGFYLLVSFIFYGLYVGMAVLMQNQPRYQLLITPVAISAIVLVISQFKSSKILTAVVAIGCLGLLAIDVLLIKRLNSSATAEAATLRMVVNDTRNIDSDARVALFGSDVASRVSLVTSMRPRPTLMVQTNLLSENKINQVLDTFGAEFIISDKLIEETNYNARLLNTISNAGHLGQLHIYTRNTQ